MTVLTFGLRLDSGYMWYWFCSHANGTLLAKSADSFFHKADAENALNTVRFGMSQQN